MGRNRMDQQDWREAGESQFGKTPVGVDFEVKIRGLMAEGLQYPPNSPERRKIQNELLRSLERSGLFRRRHDVDEDIHAAAKLETIQYFVRYLWSSETEVQPFCTPGCKVLHRLAKTFKYKKIGQRSEVWQEEARLPRLVPSPEADRPDPIEQISAPQPSENGELLGDLAQALAQSPEQTPALEKSMKSRPEVTMRRVIAARCLDGREWKDLAEEWRVSVTGLKSFFQRDCIPWLQDWCRKHGYHD